VDLGGVVLKSWPVFTPFLEADKIINLPIAKHHVLTGATLGMKNWYGILGGQRNRLHQQIHQSLADLANFMLPTLTLMDCYRILLRNGPTGGNLEDVALKKTMVAGTDPVAIDAYVAKAYWNLDPEQMPYLADGRRARVQGNDLAAHVARGGQLGSKGAAFGLAVATLAVLVGLVVLAAYEIQNHNSVTIGTKDQVFYSGTATKADATALGNALKSGGYFQDRGVTVLLNKGTNGTVISYVVQDGAWNQAGILASFELITWQVASAVGGYPVRVHLVNSNKDVEKTTVVGEVTFGGGDAVFYEGNATQAQAQALGQQFKTIGFFQGKGANVFVAKHDDGTTLAFVVGDDAWDSSDAINDFEIISRDVAPDIGGLPFHMQLDDNTLAVKKDELLQ
jgi:hypothetical protein